jgi:hypothetical protein
VLQFPFQVPPFVKQLATRFLSEIPGDLLNQWNLRPSNAYHEVGGRGHHDG